MNVIVKRTNVKTHTVTLSNEDIKKMLGQKVAEQLELSLSNNNVTCTVIISSSSGSIDRSTEFSAKVTIEEDMDGEALPAPSVI